MATQTLKYEDNGFASVAVDQAGNFVTDNAGNLVIPIAPIQIEFNSEGNHSNCTCVRIQFSTSESGLGVDLVKCKTDDNTPQITPAWQIKSTDIHTVYLASRFGNIDPKLPILSYKIYAGIDVECYDDQVEYDSSATYIKISWGDKTIQSAVYEVCHKNKRTFYYGNLHIDLINMTLTYDEQPILLGKENKKCSCGDPTDEIEIYAPYAWCGVYTVENSFVLGVPPVTYISGHIYTENENPAVGEYFWLDDEVTIPVYPDQSVSEAIDEYPRKGVIHNVQTREYITTHINGGRTVQLLWRDKEKDQKGDGADNWIVAYKCQKDDDANDNLWVEKRYTDADVTGRVWSKVWEGAPAEGVGKPEYLATKNIVATDLEWKQKTTDAKYPCSIQISPNVYSGYFVPQETLIFSGASYDWWEIRGYVDFTGANPNLPTGNTFWVYGGRLPYDDTRLDLSKYSLEERLDIAAFGHGSGTDPGMIHNRPHVLVDGVETLPENTTYGTFYKEGSVEETGFYYNDKFYVLVPSGDVGYVYESADLFAWSTSRCSEQTTMYTKTEEPQPDTEIYNKDGAAMDERVYSKSSGVYSINGVSLTEFSEVYVKDAKEISIVDEEFE